MASKSGLCKDACICHKNGSTIKYAVQKPEFLRQNDLLANVWFGLGADIVSTHAEGKHHFDVIAELADFDSRLSRLAAP